MFKPHRLLVRALMTILLGGNLLFTPARAELPAEAFAAPAFTHDKAGDWLNSKPLSWADLHDRVTLVDVWTFACWNCYRSIPWLHSLETRYGARGFGILGVHTPELPQERVRANVVQKLSEFKITHPVMLDNDYSYWNKLGNHYWPAFYIVDRQGRIRGRFIGETHAGDRNAREVEGLIEKLLTESQ